MQRKTDAYSKEMKMPVLSPLSAIASILHTSLIFRSCMSLKSLLKLVGLILCELKSLAKSFLSLNYPVTFLFGFFNV